jgi:hypothetical protein
LVAEVGGSADSELAGRSRMTTVGELKFQRRSGVSRATSDGGSSQGSQRRC